MKKIRISEDAFQILAGHAKNNEVSVTKTLNKFILELGQNQAAGEKSNEETPNANTTY